MNQPNLQRMVVVFLAFALIAGSSAFFFSNFNFGSTPPANNQTSGQNVAVESLNSVTQGNSDNAFANSPNLTNLIAKNLAGQIQTANPDGPQQAPDGNYILNTPSDSLVEKTANEILSQNKINIDEKISESDIKVIEKPTTQNITDYIGVNLPAIFGELYTNESNSLNEFKNSNNGPALNNSVKNAYKTAFEKLLATAVPKPLEDIHLGFLKILADQKDVYEIAGNYQIDPVKSFLAIKNGPSILARDLQEINSSLKQVGNTQPKTYSFFDSLFKKISLINTAYAELTQTPSGIIEGQIQSTQSSNTFSTFLNSLTSGGSTPTTGGTAGRVGGTIGATAKTAVGGGDPTAAAAACGGVGGNSAGGKLASLAGASPTDLLQGIQNRLQQLLPVGDLFKLMSDQTLQGLIGQLKSLLSTSQQVPVSEQSNTTPQTQIMTKNSQVTAQSEQTQVQQKNCEFIYGTVLQMVKNILLDQLQNQIVSWIQGGGKPQFITNWSGFLGQVANEALGNTLYELDPHLCSGFAPLVNVALSPPSYTYTPVQCTLTQVVGNLQQLTNFYNDFSYGGWNAYGAVLEVQNNPFGALIESHDIALQKIADARSSANSQAIAGQGYLSPTVCIKQNADGSCAEKKVVTPAAYIGHVVAQSADFIPQEIISADRFEQLITAISGALINKVMSSAGGFLGAGVSSPQQVINQYQYKSSYSGLLNPTTPVETAPTSTPTSTISISTPTSTTPTSTKPIGTKIPL